MIVIFVGKIEDDEEFLFVWRVFVDICVSFFV